MIKGTEKVGVCDISQCTVTEQYNEKKDVEFMTSLNPDEWQILEEGDFLVLFPNDAHKPSININPNIENKVKKAVVKVAVN